MLVNNESLELGELSLVKEIDYKYTCILCNVWNQFSVKHHFACTVMETCAVMSACWTDTVLLL
jgi:hypothetical protein